MPRNRAPSAELDADKGTERSTGAVPRLWVWAALEALIAFGLAMFRIGSRSIWYDEGVSAVVSGASWGEIEHYARTRDPNQAGYHVALHLWRDAFGSTEVALRSLSAAAVGITVLVLVALARRLHDDRTALVAGLILAVAPFAVRYGQEARSYALTMLAVTVATYCFVRMVDPDDPTRDRTWPVVAYAVVAAYACYLHLFAGFVIAAHALSLVVVDRAWLRWRRLAASAALLVALLLLIPVWFLTGYTDTIAFIERPRPADLLHISSELAGGGAITMALGGLVVVAFVQLARRLRCEHRSRDTWSDGLGLAWLVVPFVASFAISVTVVPIVLGRYLLVSLPALALVGATAAVRIRPRFLAIAALVIVVLASLVTVASKYDGSVEDWGLAAERVAAEATPRDGVVVCTPNRRAPFEYYLTRTLAPARRPVPLSPKGAWASGLRHEGASADEAGAWVDGGPTRIWLVGHPDLCGFELEGRERVVSQNLHGIHVQRFDRR